MQHVYGGSYLNIAASSTTSVHGGCWLKPSTMRSALRAKITEGNERFVREITDDESYKRAFWASHLASRAWALQEKLLPQRTVHFGDCGVYWECRSKKSPASSCLTALPAIFSQDCLKTIIIQNSYSNGGLKWSGCSRAQTSQSYATGFLRYLVSRGESIAGRTASTLLVSGETNGSRPSYASASRSRSYTLRPSESRASLRPLLMAPCRISVDA